MEGYDERHSTIRVPEADVATTLAHKHPAELAEGGDQLCAREDREAIAQAGSVSLRRITPMSRDRPSSRMPST